MTFLDLRFAQPLTLDQMADIEEAMRWSGSDFDPETSELVMLLQPMSSWLRERKYSLWIIDITLEIILRPDRWFLSLPVDPDDPETSVMLSPRQIKLLAKFWNDFLNQPSVQQALAPQDRKRKIRDVTMARDLRIKEIKDKYPLFSYKQVVNFAQRNGFNISEDDVVNAYRRQNWTWKRANSL